MLEISANLMSALRKEAEAAYPGECCGLLVGTAGKVTRAVLSPNILAQDGNDVFEVDPQVRIDTEREVRGTSERVIGHYHSHPDHPAQPSTTDVQRAFEPDLIWLIISVEQSRAGAARAFNIVEGQVTELVLTIGETPGAG